jgi:hypothetical protein
LPMSGEPIRHTLGYERSSDGASGKSSAHAAVRASDHADEWTPTATVAVTPRAAAADA